MVYNQSEYDLRLEWGLRGVRELASASDLIIIVDVLSFGTTVDIATSRGALIFPYQTNDRAAFDYAQSLNADLAAANRTTSAGYSLSPASMQTIPEGTRLVLASPNGAALSLATGNRITICACLRNISAVAAFASSRASSISVIAAGEQWSDRTLRPAFEDLLAAGAILSAMKGSMSPEAQSAVAVYQNLQSQTAQLLRSCSSGKELIERGFEQDVELAAQIDSSTCVPLLQDGAYSRAT